MMPKVVIHIVTSLDGKVNGFEADIGAYYKLAETFEPDCMLSGSNTILAADMPDPVPEWCFEAAAQYSSCSRMIMAIVDSQGRIRNWNAIKKQPFWKKPVALCSKSTPKEYLDYLKKEGIEFIIAGKEKVDLPEAMKELHLKFGVETIRIDSGGTLSTLMLAQGLVDEISLLLHPGIAGNLSSKRFIEDAGLKLGKPIDMRLEHVEKLENDYVWLKYTVIK